MSNSWQEKSELRNIDKKKLEMLQQLAEQGKGKSPSEMLSFFMEASRKGRQNNLEFSQNEISVILDTLKEGKSPQEKARMDRIIGLMKMIK